MIFSGPAASRRTVRSICIHRSYGIKYTWHVHESDNCHSCSTDVSINRVRSFVLPFVRVGSLARSFVFTPSHFFPFLFLCISLFLCLARFIYRHNPAIRASFSPTELWYDSIRDSCLSFCISRRSTKRGYDARQREAKRKRVRARLRRTGKFFDVESSFFVGAVFNEFTHFVSSDKSGKSRPAVVDKRSFSMPNIFVTFSRSSPAPLCQQSRRN